MQSPRRGAWRSTRRRRTSKRDEASAIALERQAIARADRPEYRYNLVCYLAINGQREQAIAELGSAIDHGFLDADQMIADGDLAASCVATRASRR